MKTFLTILLVVSPFAAHADPAPVAPDINAQIAQIEADEKVCLANPKSQEAIQDCQKSSFDKVDALLNQVFANAQSAVSVDQAKLALLNKSQDAWTTYKHADDNLSGIAGIGNNDIENTLFESRDIELKKSRIRELSNLAAFSEAGGTFENADAALNQVYKQITGKLKSSVTPDNTEILKRLVNTQRAWIAFRDANCLLKQTLGIGIDICKRDMTLEQTKDVSAVSDFIE